MAEVSRQVAASPERVFEVLADGWLYTTWVVGASHIRAVDAEWPDPGSRIHHAVGAWPVLLEDETQVEECEAPSRLVLIARGRPFGEARVGLRLSASGNGTRVTMVETPVSGPGKWLHNPLAEAVLRRRNQESLDRLAVLAVRPTRPA